MSASLWREREGERALDVLGVGQCSIDHVCGVEGLPEFAGKAAMLDYALLPGGQVATALLACARLGLRGAYVGTTGDDAAASEVLAPLVAAGVDVAGVRRVAGAATRLAVILVDRASGERTVLWYRDPRLRLAPGDVPVARIAESRCLLLDADDPEAAIHAARVARAAGVPVVLDMDALEPASEALLREVDFPIVSHRFAQHLARDGTVRSGLARMVELGARLAVATLGAEGFVALDAEGRELARPGVRVAVRDTTGAGDVFHAAFAWGLLEGFDAERCLAAANAAAALACRELGAQGGIPTRAEVARQLAAEGLEAPGGSAEE